MKAQIGLIVFALVMLTMTYRLVAAQDKPASPPVADKLASSSTAPQVPEDAKRAVEELQRRDKGLADAQAVIQKERDALQADFARLVQRLQAQCSTAPGYELAPNMTCVVKKEPK